LPGIQRKVQSAYEYTCYRQNGWRDVGVDKLRETRRLGFSRGLPWENELRVRSKDGQYRWFLIRYSPLVDDHGHVVRWCAAGTDIDKRKRDEERLREENLALREEIDHSSMFE